MKRSWRESRRQKCIVRVHSQRRALSLLLFFCLLVGFTLPAHAQRTFYYGGHKVKPPRNIRKLKWKNKKAKEELGPPVEGAYYLVGQFRRNPTHCDQLKLSLRGMELLQYLGDRTYFVRIDTAQFQQAIKKSKLVSLFPAEWRWKCDRAIVEDSVSPAPEREDGGIGIVVAPFSGYTLEWIQAKLLTMDIEGKHVYANQPFNTFALWLPRDEIIILAQEGWVRYISLAGEEVKR